MAVVNDRRGAPAVLAAVLITALIMVTVIALSIADASGAEAKPRLTSSTKWVNLNSDWSVAAKKTCDGLNLVYVSYNSIAVSPNDPQCGGK